MAKKAVKAVPEPKKSVDPENFSEAIRKILVDARDPRLKASIVSERLSAEYPDSQMVAKKTADKSFSVYVSGQREKAAEQLGIEYVGRVKTTEATEATVVQGAKVTLKDFANSEIDSDALRAAIHLIEKAGSIAEVKNLADKWNKLIEKVGIESAKDVVDIL